VNECSVIFQDGKEISFFYHSITVYKRCNTKFFLGDKYDGCLIFTKEQGFCQVFVFFSRINEKDVDENLNQC